MAYIPQLRGTLSHLLTEQRVDDSRSETTGEPLPAQPGPVLLPGAASEGIIEYLTAEVERRGFGLEYVENGVDRWNGQAIWNLKLVQIATTGRDEVAQAKTLVHELGHVMLHDPESKVSRDIGETESVAFVLNARFGLDSSDCSLDDIAGWVAADLKAAETTASCVVKVSQSVMKIFDNAVKAVAAEITVEEVEATVERIIVAAQGVRTVTSSRAPGGLFGALSVAGDASMIADMVLRI